MLSFRAKNIFLRGKLRQRLFLKKFWREQKKIGITYPNFAGTAFWRLIAGTMTKTQSAFCSQMAILPSFANVTNATFSGTPKRLHKTCEKAFPQKQFSLKMAKIFAEAFVSNSDKWRLRDRFWRIIL